jgi:hypothetical protein
MDIQLRDGSVTVERTKRDNTPIVRLTFTEPVCGNLFHVSLRPLEAVRLSSALHGIGVRKTDEHVSAKGRMSIHVDQFSVELVRWEGSKQISQKHNVTPQQARALIEALR